LTIVASQDVWKATIADPDFQKYSPLVKRVMKPFIETLHQTIWNYLPEKVTLTTLMGAQEVFFENLFASDLMFNVSKNFPYWVFGFENAMELSLEIEDMLLKVIANCQRYLRNPERELKKINKKRNLKPNSAEEDLLKFVLNPDVFKLYKEGNLTVSQLLIMQPCVIIHHYW